MLIKKSLKIIKNKTKKITRMLGWNYTTPIPERMGKHKLEVFFS
jgi:hypothetical protein